MSSFVILVTKSIGIGLISVPLLFVFVVYIRFRYLNNKYGHLPAEKDFHWFWGNIQRLQRTSPGEERLRDSMVITEKLPRLQAMWYGVVKVSVMVYHPDTVKTILKSTEPKSTTSGAYRLGLPWLGFGLLTSSGERWQRNRRLLTPAFHFDILRPYMTVYNGATDTLLKKLESQIECDSCVEIYEQISLATLEIIMKCAFFKEESIQEQGTSDPYVKAISELQDMWCERGTKPYLYPDFIYYLTNKGKTFRKNCDYVHSVTEKIIAERKRFLENGGSSKKRFLDFLDILLTAKDENGDGLSAEEIRTECNTFLFEGHDTTASSIAWILFSLAGHPREQTRAQEEVDNVLHGKEDLEWDDLKHLDYLSCCIKEALRLHCPIPFIQRDTTSEITVDGYKIPPGTTIDIHLYRLHHNPTVWNEPMEYNPERFLKENSSQRNNFAFIPFSAGPRNCIGQHFAMHEMKVLVSRIIHRFDLSLDHAHPTRKKMNLVMRTESGMKLRLTPRKTL